MKRLLCALAIVSGLAGCVLQPKIPPHVASKLGEQTERVLVKDVVESALSDGTLKISVLANHVAGFPEKVRYRFNWFDQDGHRVATSVDNWETRSLRGNSAFDFTGVGPGPRAVRYVIDITTD